MVHAGAFWTRMSPLVPFSKANSTRSTASSSVMTKRVMPGSVTVIGLPALICPIQSGTTLPREQSTLPYRVHAIFVAEVVRLLATMTFSIPIYCLGGPHRVDRIDGFVRRQADHRLHPGIDRRRQHVLRPDDVGLDRFHWEELAGGDLLERRRVEDVVDPVHRVPDRSDIAHIADEEFDLVRHFRHLQLKLMPHVILLLLVAGEDADFADVGGEETVEDRIAENLNYL